MKAKGITSTINELKALNSVNSSIFYPFISSIFLETEQNLRNELNPIQKGGSENSLSLKF